MKNTLMVFVVLCMMSLAWIAATKNSETENQSERAIFAAPCPGEVTLWCVALEPDGPESGLTYSFKKGADNKIVFVREKVARVETVKANFPKNLIKNWGITPTEVILATYNGEELPKKNESDYNWFMLHETSAKLNMWKSTARDELTFTETVKKESSVAWVSIWMFAILLLAGTLLGVFCKKYWHALLLSLFPVGFFAMVLSFEKITTLDDIFLHIDLIILYVLSTPIVAMLVRPLRALIKRKDREKNRVN